MMITKIISANIFLIDYKDKAIALIAKVRISIGCLWIVTLISQTRFSSQPLVFTRISDINPVNFQLRFAC